ncbi:ABC transporter permease [Candidatus Margulisiibacteriota bacterium]
MILFLAKGLFRDRSRSLFPILTVISGAFLTVLLISWIDGAFGTIIKSNAIYNSGHVKVMTRAYAEIPDQLPNDLVITNAPRLQRKLKKQYPDWNWLPRIKFGGLLDIPDKEGDTRVQGPVMGFGIDLFSKSSVEKKLLKLKKALVKGRLPRRSQEALISENYAQKLGIKLGEQATLISSTMYGGLAAYNFKIVGTVEFNIMALDKRTIVADIRDLRIALDMPWGASEIIGLRKDMVFDNEQTKQLSAEYNKKYSNKKNEFSPKMLAMGEQAGLGTWLELAGAMSVIMIGIFVLAMSLVLWNSGLMGALRRYGEIGLRLAMGEPKGAIYRSLIIESVIIGFVGSVLGTLLGLAAAFYLQEHGLDMRLVFRDTTTIMDNIMRARITPACYYLGFIPGLLASVLGTVFAGIGIYKRQTAQLFKELEV